MLNADDPRVAAFAAAHRGRTVLYGLSRRGRCAGAGRAHVAGWRRVSGGPRRRSNSSLAGRHGVSNLLAGIAVAKVYGIEPERLVEAVAQSHTRENARGALRIPGILIYNDCYNSNPDAVRAMLDVLRDTPAQRRIAVLGEMLELGRWAEPLHRDVGDYAARGV